jgi:hypothetical protein
VCGGVPLHVPVVHLDHTGEENGEKGNKEKDEAKNVLAGDVAHKWQPCSTSTDTIVK